MPGRRRRGQSRPIGGGGRIIGTIGLLMFLGFGLFLGWLILNDLSRTASTYGWTEVQCQILSSGVRESEKDNDPTPYDLTFEYEYQFGNETLRSQQYQLKETGFADYRKAQKLADRFPEGATARCYVNPASPREAVLIRGSLWQAATLVVPLLFVALPAGGIWLLWRARDAAPDQLIRPVTERANPALAKRAGCFLIPFFGLFLVLGLVVFGLMFIRPVLQIQAAKTWPEVPCVIESSSVKSSRSDDSTVYRADILYRYEFNGRPWKSSRYHFADGASKGRQRSRELVAAYRTGTESVCYVNPKDPTEAVLRREFLPVLWLGLIPLVFVVVGLAGVSFGVRKARQTEEAARFIQRGTAPFNPVPPAGGPVTLQPSAAPIGKFVAMLIMAVFWNGIVSVFVLQVVKGWQRDGGFMEKWFLPIFLIPFVLIGLAVIGGVFHAFLGLFNPRPRLKVNARAIPLGGSLQLDWDVPRGSGRLERLTIALVGREETSYRRDTKTHHDRNVFLTIPILDSTDRRDIQQGHAQVQIPTTTMHSFRAANNGITWTLQLRGIIRRWPDVEADYTVEVLPKP